MLTNGSRRRCDEQAGVLDWLPPGRVLDPEGLALGREENHPTERAWDLGTAVIDGVVIAASPLMNFPVLTVCRLVIRYVDARRKAAEEAAARQEAAERETAAREAAKRSRERRQRWATRGSATAVLGVLGGAAWQSRWLSGRIRPSLLRELALIRRQVRRTAVNLDQGVGALRSVTLRRRG